ncbi:MAG: GMC family oxidoreductase [Pseudomonadota bacterium]
MIIDVNKLDSNATITSDICIMGGGVAGIVLANELKKHNKSIVIIESGDEVLNPETQSLYSGDVINDIYPNPEYSRLRMLGGSSNHWENNTSPLDKMDFEKREWVDNSGWPIQLSDLEDYYLKAGVYCGTKNDGYQTQTWAARLNHEVLGSKRNILETGIAKVSTPPVRFFTEYGKALSEAENVKIYKNSNIVDIDYNSSSEKIEKVYFETSPGKRHTVDSKIFIMCFGGLENARMLLHFNQKNSNKIGNYYDNVGRYFMDHPVVRAGQLFPNDIERFSLYQGNDLETRVVLGYFKLSESTLKKNKLNNIRVPLVANTNYIMSDGISSSHILGDALSAGELPDDFSSHITNILKDIDMIAEGVSRKKFDTKLFDKADEIYGYQLPIMLEQTPDRNNRIILGEKNDIYGIKKIVIDWKLKEADKANLWKSLEIIAQEFGAESLGRIRMLKERSIRIWRDQLGFGHHHMGTTRMSSDYKKGVVDKKHLVYSTKNLFIAGSSVFPTGGHVPPTLTIVAMSIRLADIISKEHLV